VLVITLGVFLLSLLGLPPLAGFAAKFQIFSVLFEGAQDFAKHNQRGLSYTLYGLLVIGGLNTVLSLFYYVKVLRVMVLDPPLEVVENRPVEKLPTPFIPNLYLVVLASLLVVVGIFWDFLSTASSVDGVNSFAHAPVPVRTAPATTAQGAP
jgi:NADH-quinone oxidoreductase subunit N